jgi:hypothetical protein
MILLVDHHAERFILVEHQSAAGALGGMFAANQVALDQYVLIED